MCEAMESIKKDERDRAMVDAILNLGETLGLSPVEAMNALKIPTEVQKKYQKLVADVVPKKE